MRTPAIAWLGLGACPTCTHALVQAHAALAAGSAFFHAQGSPRGGPGIVSDKLDNVPIGLIALTAHQASIAALGESPILQDLAIDGKPCRSAIDSTAAFVDVVANNSVDSWDSLLQSKVIPDVHDYKLTCEYLSLTHPHFVSSK